MRQYDEEQNTEEVQGQSICEDKWLVCKDCQQDFLLEVGEQEFLLRLEREGGRDRDGNRIDMPYREPKRCRDCRNKRRAAREQV